MPLPRYRLPQVHEGECSCNCGGILPEFDYAVIKFDFTEGGGTDLDTRTELEDVDPSYDGILLGWCQYGTAGDSFGAIVAPPGSDVGSGPYYLFWGGDNTTSAGIEAHLINFPQIITDFPSVTTIDIPLHAYWYSTRETGNFTLRFVTYLGGTMERDGTDFVNIGGMEVTNLSVPRNAVTNESSCIEGDSMGLLSYDVATKVGTIIDP